MNDVSESDGTVVSASSVVLERFSRLRGLSLRPNVAWMLAAELNDFGEMRARFDGAMRVGNFLVMQRAAVSLVDRTGLHDLPRDIVLQCALLHDRVGDFDAARRLLDSVSFPDPHTRLGAELLTADIAVSHGTAGEANIDRLRSSDDPLIAAAGRYWALHVALGHGVFAVDDLSVLLDELRECVDVSDRWSLSVLARTYFDRFRQLYLSGAITFGDVVDDNSFVNDMLNGTVPTYRAFMELYTKAHYCGHVLLPACAFRNRLPSLKEAQHLGYWGDSQTKLDTLDKLLVANKRLYCQTQDLFALVGDREALFMQGDVVNASVMVADPAEHSTVEADLDRYHKFIVEAGFGDLQALPHIYLARFHALAYFGGLLGVEGAGDTLTTDEHLFEAEQHLLKAHRFDVDADNLYGQQRAELLQIILKAATLPADRGALEDLKLRASNAGYGGIVDIIELADNCDLTASEVRNFVRFMPIVHQ